MSKEKEKTKEIFTQREKYGPGSFVSEKEMREAKVPWPKTEDELVNYIKSLVDREHDYGTCVYAMSMAAVAAFYYVSSKLGVTGFQASCADLDILRRTRSIKNGFMILDYDNLLYPQYCNEEYFPTAQHLIDENLERLRPAAKKLIAEERQVHPDVLAHWKRIAGMSNGSEENAK